MLAATTSTSELVQNARLCMHCVHARDPSISAMRPPCDAVSIRVNSYTTGNTWTFSVAGLQSCGPRGAAGHPLFRPVTQPPPQHTTPPHIHTCARAHTHVHHTPPAPPTYMYTHATTTTNEHAHTHIRARELCSAFKVLRVCTLSLYPA